VPHPKFTKKYKAMLAHVCRQVCEEFALEKAYFAEVLGQRRHYLAGHGQEGFVRAEHMPLDGDMAFFWQGHLTEGAQRRLRAALAQLMADLDEELNGSTANDDAMPSR
jgi:hypothetical protein